MNKPRTPRYFPKMKVRGARRRDKAVWERLYRKFDHATLTFSDLSNAMTTANQQHMRFLKLVDTTNKE